MTIEALRHAQTMRPFRPYTLNLAGGRKIRVKSPEFVATSPARRTLAIAVGDAFEIVDLLMVDALTFGNGLARRRPEQ